MPEPRVILSGLAYVESPRWHDGRLWFAHWGTDEIMAVDLAGSSQVIGHGPGGLGWSIDWLPDGRLLVTGPGLTRHQPDGSLSRTPTWGHSPMTGTSWSSTAAATRTSTAGSSVPPRMVRRGSLR